MGGWFGIDSKPAGQQHSLPRRLPPPTLTPCILVAHWLDRASVEISCGQSASEILSMAEGGDPPSATTARAALLCPHKTNQ